MAVIASILRVSLTSADPTGLAAFYRDVLGFSDAGVVRQPASEYGLDGGQATAHRLRLGAQEIELVGFDFPGAPYPATRTSHDAVFQHMALITPDMNAALARLRTGGGWSPVSHDGVPVQLPASSGGATAFKFRDPEGHPLEILQFPPDAVPPVWQARKATPLLGIDHTAIAVTDAPQSRAFYEPLGFSVSAHSLNRGPEQDRLDAADAVDVAVYGLAPPQTTPHLELLAYARPALRAGHARPNDVACTRTVLHAANGVVPPGDRLRHDPDGHTILLVED